MSHVSTDFWTTGYFEIPVCLNLEFMSALDMKNKQIKYLGDLKK